MKLDLEQFLLKPSLIFYIWKDIFDDRDYVIKVSIWLTKNLFEAAMYKIVSWELRQCMLS